MFEERISVIQRACEAWGTREFDVFHELYTSDVVADGGSIWLETGAVHGVEAVVGNFEQIISMFERNECFPEGAFDAGDTLVVPMLWRGLTPGSEQFIEQHLIGVFGFRGTQINSLRWFADLDEGLAAVGLSRADPIPFAKIDSPTDAEAPVADVEEPAG
ncbi:MAG TPA: nuclear transport factor 2 family protein [Solirubrobacteraceae bacterium]